MKMDWIVERCPRVLCIHDDVCIYGKSEQEHDLKLMKVAGNNVLILTAGNVR